jgi:hypothetical protein
MRPVHAQKPINRNRRRHAASPDDHRVAERVDTALLGDAGAELGHGVELLGQR